MSRRFTALLVLALVAIATASIAALGSSNASAGAEARALGAVAVPAEALAYASVNADRDGAAWQQLEVLAARVPGGADALKQLDARMDGDGAAMDALGGDISVGLLGVDVAGGSADAIVVATAADGAKLTQELERMGFVEGPDLNGAKVWEKDAFAVSVDGPVAIAATSPHVADRARRTLGRGAGSGRR